jgi:putative transposon-encoded protein
MKIENGAARKILRTIFFVASFSISNFRFAHLLRASAISASTIALGLSSVQFSILTTSCSRTELVENPNPRENSLQVLGKSFEVDRLSWKPDEIEYLDRSKDEIVSLRVVGKAGLSVDIPKRLLGQKIVLTSRDTSPPYSRGNIYYSFHISVRDDGDDEYGDWPYCRINSWVIDSYPIGHPQEDRFDNFGGWFTVTAGNAPNEWILEWDVVSLLSSAGDSEPFSTGYIAAVFEPLG